MNHEEVLRALAAQDSRYPVEAYFFIEEAVKYAFDAAKLDLHELEPALDHFESQEQHFTGQQLCELIRRYAITQYGYLAKLVLTHWNMDGTSCFGDIVYAMIDAGLMAQSSGDRREDFDNVYQFEDVFETDVEINSSTALL